jgi:phosphoglycolate phosphatase
MIFDFDGTLADTMPLFLSLFDEAADQYGFRRVQQDGLEAMRGLDARQIMTQHEVPLWKLPVIAAFMRRRMAGMVDRIRLFSGVFREVAELLRQD